MEKSSMSTMTMLGRPRGEACAPAAVPEWGAVEGPVGLRSAAIVGAPQAAANNAVTEIAAAAIGVRRISPPPWYVRHPETSALAIVPLGPSPGGRRLDDPAGGADQVSRSRTRSWTRS